MALPPKFKAFRLGFPGASSATSEPVHTVELYLDYVCPFSAKLFNTVYGAVAPYVRSQPALAGRVQFIFRPQVQPWHPSSTLVHEAGLAVARATGGDSARFWGFAAALFADQKAYFDINAATETRNATYRRLARLAAQSPAAVDEDEVYNLLAIPDAAGADGSLNGGNAVTDDLKVAIKMARLVSVHVSPTVIFDGVVANDISSSWTGEQWSAWLHKNVA